MAHVRRQVREEEIELLRFLAQHDPELRDQYLDQIGVLREVEDWSDSTGSITLFPDEDKQVRVNATATDRDGTQVDVMLWGNRHRVCMLEIVPATGVLHEYPSLNSVKDVWDYKGNPRPVNW